HGALEPTWKELMLYQFHDILPGSSITRVYDEAAPRYQAMLDETVALTAAADRALCERIDGSQAAQGHVVANSLSWERAEWLRLGGAWIKARVPALGYAVVDAAKRDRFEPPQAAASRLENDRLRILFNADGSV